MKTFNTLYLLALLGVSIAAPLQENLASRQQAHIDAVGSVQKNSLITESSQPSNSVLGLNNSYQITEEDDGAEDQNDDDFEDEIDSRDPLIQSAMRRNIAVLIRGQNSGVDQTKLLKRKRNGGGEGRGGGGRGRGGDGSGNGGGIGGGGRGREDNFDRDGTENEDDQN
ncbi:hypothetical protein GcM1_200035 [Golovinomyces cichoracearum]|uniref:Uncharacterized protein n=1 Tax=Golovinomyces cichoracearum TaxID=62708 RepID=A0A420IYU2_9PEZI|nr:hypothetical protein GcM1_200035 [Golovinomyces cichoracearum]